MTSQANRILTVLLDRLRAVSTANGYGTDLQGVYRGHEALNLPDSAPHPFLVVQRLRAREEKRVGTRSKQRCEVLIYGEVGAAADEEEALEQLRLDVLRALNPAGEEPWLPDCSVTVDLKDAVFAPPEEGSEVAAFSQYLDLIYVEDLRVSP